MKRVLILVLLSSAVLLCSTAPALESVTCSEDSGNATARLAMHHINEHHDHGYKFRLNEIQGNKVVKVGEGCDVTLQLDLLETVCHTVNPKHFEDCEIRQETDQVMANCTVMVTVETGDAKITKYECGTRQVKSNREMVRICPDCPILIPLNSPEGLNSVNEAVKEFNKNNTNQHYYTLQEVGRIRSGYMMMAGMSYYAEFALVETNCPMGSRIIPEACKPLCPDRAVRGEWPDCFELVGRQQSITARYNQGLQKIGSECTTHLTRAHQNWTREDWRTLPGLMSLDFCCDIWMVGSQHESMDPSCPVPTVQAAAAAGVMVWEVFSWHTLDPLVPTEHHLNTTAYLRPRPSLYDISVPI
ncbi:alpha-2-HS-glycoprotein-like [Lates japonicus]